MPKYDVFVSRWGDEFFHYEVEAKTPEAAVKKVDDEFEPDEIVLVVPSASVSRFEVQRSVKVVKKASKDAA